MLQCWSLHYGVQFLNASKDPGFRPGSFFRMRSQLASLLRAAVLAVASLLLGVTLAIIKPVLIPAVPLITAIRFRASHCQ